jgi:hypothetical protein
MADPDILVESLSRYFLVKERSENSFLSLIPGILGNVGALS